ncbi:MAG: histidine--tRNA ligase [Candidatus Heimdallarchaeota archaeon]|nr:histidine--tRNA ligase [Candidatus Heimdallarchaeota archaeon]
MMVELFLLKGTKDHLPDEQILREYIIDIAKKVFHLFGFQPATTPILEPFDILASKYSGGEEILKETYKLTDQGNRELGLRYDLSVPLSRLIGMNPQLKRPFKRYEIGHCFRDGPIKKGRYREFVQMDADIVGVSSMLADAECLALAHRIFAELGLEVFLEVNNRKLLTGILIQAGVPEELIKTTILSIDKMKKIGIPGVREELKLKGISFELAEKIFSYFEYDGPYLEILDQLEPRIQNEIGKKGVQELRELFQYIQIFKIEKDVKLLYSLARGLEIYTGTVFEAFLKESAVIDSSLCGGGRYDKIIGNFLESDVEFPAVGISFGLDTIYDTLSNQKIISPIITDVYLIPIRTLEKTVEIACVLRKNNINSEIDLLNRSLSKNLEYADKNNIPYVLIIGKKDLKKEVVTLRKMKDGEEEKVPLALIIERISQLTKK